MNETQNIDGFEIGSLVGERKTLSKLAGSCSAADALCLRKIRESKQYLSKAKTWEEFCPRYLGIDRSTADRLIRHLEEFGPQSFETMQQLGLTPKQFRLLAPRMQNQELHHAGEAIALLPENGEKIHAVLREIRQAERAPAPVAETGASDLQERLRALGARCAEIVGEFRALYAMTPDDRDRRPLDRRLFQTRLRLARITIERFSAGASPETPAAPR